MVTCQSSELGWEVTVELPTDFLSLGRGSVTSYHVEFRDNRNFTFFKAPRVVSDTLHWMSGSQCATCQV